MRRMMRGSVHDVARARGSKRLGLEVRADNRQALAIYRRMGFRLEGWLPEYYEDGCAAWKMVKNLEASTLEGASTCAG